MNIADHIIPYGELTPERARQGCFVIDMPNDAYHAYEGISNSGLKLINITPAHYAYAEPQDSSRFKEMGAAIHCAILEPKRYRNDYMIVECDARTESVYRQAAKARGGETTLTRKEGRQVDGMQSAVYSNATASAILSKQGWAELSGFATDPETGVLCRIRFDWLAFDGDNLDIKKTQDARKEAFSRSITAYAYDQQAAFYCYVFELITGHKLPYPFKFLAIEQKSPHGCRVRPLDDVSMHIGAAKFRQALDTYAECEKSGIWPCYEDTEEETGLTNWAVTEFMESEEEQ